jgi:hypothetical protein
MDSSCSRHMTGSSKWFSSLGHMIGEEYMKFGDKLRGKVGSRGTIWVNNNVVLKMLLWSPICISIYFLFCNFLRMTMRHALSGAFLVFWMPRGILSVGSPHLVEFFELIFLIWSAPLNVFW